MTVISLLLISLGLVAGDNCLKLVNTDFPTLSPSFNTQAAACRGLYSPLTPAKSFNDNIFLQDGGNCWAYRVSAAGVTPHRYRFVLSAYTDAHAQEWADPAATNHGRGNFYEDAHPTTGDLLEDQACAAAPSSHPGFTNAGQGWCQDASGRGFRHYRIEQPGITEAQCITECSNMPECGSINYYPASNICIVDVDHAVSPAGATAPLWTMVSGGQGMHPVTSVDPSPDTVCFSKDTAAPSSHPGFTNAGQGWCQDASGRGFRHYRIEQPGITETQCITECSNMPECGSINYYPASNICIVDVDHAVSPAGATAPLWTMVSGGQGMHPVTSVDPSPDTVCFSKDTAAPSSHPGFTNAGQGWCQDASGRGFRTYRIEQPGITETQCITECGNMAECGSINYYPASNICIVDVDHAVSPAGATAPLWTMVSGGQGMHPVTSVDPSPDTVCFSKDAFTPTPACTNTVELRKGFRCLHDQGNNAMAMWMSCPPIGTTPIPAGFAFEIVPVDPSTPNQVRIKNSRGQYLSYQAPWQDSVNTRNLEAQYFQVWERRVTSTGVQFWNADRAAFMSSDESVNPAGRFAGFTTDNTKIEFDSSAAGCAAPAGPAPPAPTPQPPTPRPVATPQPVATPAPANDCSKVELRSGFRCLHDQGNNATPMFMSCPPVGTNPIPAAFAFEIIPVTGSPDKVRIKNSRGQYLSYQAPWQDSVMTRNLEAQYFQVWERRVTPTGVRFWNPDRAAFMAAKEVGGTMGRFGRFTNDNTEIEFDSSSSGVCSSPSAPPAGPGFELKGEGICVDGSSQAYGTLWHNEDASLTAAKCQETCNKYTGCMGVMSWAPVAPSTEFGCTLNMDANRGFMPTDADRMIGSMGWRRMDSTWSEWATGAHLGRGAVSGVVAPRQGTAYCYAKQDTTDPCGAPGSARFGCCPQLPYGRLDQGRRLTGAFTAELAICITSGEPHIMDFSEKISGAGQTTREEGDFVMYEGALLDVSVRTTCTIYSPGGVRTCKGSGNNAWTMSGALIGYNTIEYFGAAEIGVSNPVFDRPTSEVYWNGNPTSTQELCDVHLKDYACSCKYDTQVDVLSGVLNTNRHIEIVFNKDYMFRAATWLPSKGWMNIVLTVDPNNVGKPGQTLDSNNGLQVSTATIAGGSVARGGFCNKGGLVGKLEFLKYKIDCASNNAFLINRLGGSMLLHDPAAVASFCYRRRQQAPAAFIDDGLTDEEHVAKIINECEPSLKAQAESFCGICDSEFLTKRCLFDACVLGEVSGAGGSRAVCQDKLLIEAAPGQEASVCDADQMWDAERQICRDPNWSNCDDRRDTGININALANSGIFPSSWDPSTAIHGGTLPEEKGWPVSTTEECRALCDAEPRCTAWETNLPIQHPEWHPVAHCWLYDGDDVEEILYTSGKLIMGTKCAGSGGDPEQPNCEDPAFIASCTQSFMNVDGCSVMARAEAGELDDEQDIESALSGVDRQCFMCENIGEEVQAICQSQQGRAPKDILREIIDDAEESVDILREIIEDAEELEDADLPADVKKLTVLMRDLTKAQKSLGKTKSKASKTRKRVKAANKTKKTRGQ